IGAEANHLNAVGHLKHSPKWSYSSLPNIPADLQRILDPCCTNQVEAVCKRRVKRGLRVPALLQRESVESRAVSGLGVEREAVSSAGDGLNKMGGVRIRLDLAPHTADQPAHKVAIAFTCITPDALDDDIDGDN